MRLLVTILVLLLTPWIGVAEQSSAGSNSSHSETCSQLLSLSPVSESARLKRLFLPLAEVLGGEMFLPRGAEVSIQPKSVADIRAIKESLSNGKKEVHFVRVLNSQGEVIFETDLLLGNLTEINVYDHLIQTVKALRKMKLENEILTVEDAHTHPWIPGRSIISAGDVKSALMFRTILELSGFKRTTLEASILNMKFSEMDYEKKTMILDPIKVSYLRGDFSVGKRLDDIIRGLSQNQLKDIIDLL